MNAMFTYFISHKTILCNVNQISRKSIKHFSECLNFSLCPPLSHICIQCLRKHHNITFLHVEVINQITWRKKWQCHSFVGRVKIQRIHLVIAWFGCALRWRHNGRDSVSRSPAPRLFTQPFIQTQSKENINAPRHWRLCGESTGDPHKWLVTRKMFPFWWRHHEQDETTRMERTIAKQSTKMEYALATTVIDSPYWRTMLSFIFALI